MHLIKGVKVMQKYNKTWAALVVGAISSYLATYFTPELIQVWGTQIGQLVTTGFVAAATSLMVYLVPNKEK